MAKLTFIGHAAVEVQSGGYSILIDPFISQNPVAKHKAEDFKPNAILLTHGHSDHVGDAVEIAKRANCPVIATFELASYCESQGAPNSVGMNTGGVKEFEFGRVMFTPAFHSSSLDGRYMGQACGIVFTTKEGKKVYHAGDTALFGDMALIGKQGIDLALLPIGSHFTMDPEAAAQAVELIQPKIVVPIHYSTFPPIEQDPQRFKEVVGKGGRTSAQVVILQPGESFEF
jgi:L-ascorbate metabolism protein UlaG (beta-lactamase superfamily)